MDRGVQLFLDLLRIGDEGPLGFAQVDFLARDRFLLRTRCQDDLSLDDLLMIFGPLPFLDLLMAVEIDRVLLQLLPSHGIQLL